MISAGAGFRIALKPNVILRAEFRDYLTPFPGNVIAAAPGVHISGWVHDFVPLVGISYLFGKVSGNALRPFVNDAVFHDQQHLPGLRNIDGGMAGYRNYIGDLASLERAQAVCYAQQLGVHRRAGF